MNEKQNARWSYARRRRERSDYASLGPVPELPAEMTEAGKRMEIELQERRDEALKRQLQRSRLKRHKLYAVKLLNEVRS